MVPGPSLHLVLGLVLLLAVVACAPTERETETPPPDETAALEEFQLQADQVCLGTRAELQLLRTELFERDEDIALPPEEALQPFERAAALLRTELTQLQELSPPDPFANDLEVWLAEVEQAAAAYEEAGRDPDAAAALLDEGDPLRSAEALADQYGLGLCGTARIPDDELGDPRSVPTEDDETTAPAIEEGQEG
jgi:hypothetical protein